MGLLAQILHGSLHSFLKSATDDELKDAYEKERKKWLATGQNGDGEHSHVMKSINKEMSKREAKKREKNPYRSSDPDYRWTDKNRWE